MRTDMKAEEAMFDAKLNAAPLTHVLANGRRAGREDGTASLPCVGITPQSPPFQASCPDSWPRLQARVTNGVVCTEHVHEDLIMLSGCVCLAFLGRVNTQTLHLDWCGKLEGRRGDKRRGEERQDRREEERTGKERRRKDWRGDRTGQERRGEERTYKHVPVVVLVRLKHSAKLRKHRPQTLMNDSWFGC